MKAVYIFFMACILPLTSLAQRYKVFSWEGGIFSGAANYSGDINPMESPRLQDTRLSVGVVGRVPLDANFSVRSSLLYGKLVGDDLNFPDRKQRGFRFETNLFELSVLMEFEPFARDRFYADARGNLRMDRLISPYLVTGVGFAYTSLNPDFSRNTNTVLQPRISEDLRESSTRFIPVVPIGFGLKFDLNPRYGFSIESGIRMTFSDYIDGISKAANPGRDDVYLFSGLIFVRRF